MSRWNRIEKIAPRAAQVTAEFVRSPAAEPEVGLEPTFNQYGNPTGVNIHPPRDDGSHSRAEVHDFIILRPGEQAEVMSAPEFCRDYEFRK